MPSSRSSSASTGSQRPACQVCLADLVGEKVYLQTKQICSTHMKAFAVECPGLAGQHRFCFQCGKLEALDCFDGPKRSCRRKLNMRRARSVPSITSAVAAEAWGAAMSTTSTTHDPRALSPGQHPQPLQQQHHHHQRSTSLGAPALSDSYGLPLLPAVVGAGSCAGAGPQHSAVQCWAAGGGGGGVPAAATAAQLAAELSKSLEGHPAAAPGGDMRDDPMQALVVQSMADELAASILSRSSSSGISTSSTCGEGCACALAAAIMVPVTPPQSTTAGAGGGAAPPPACPPSSSLAGGSQLPSPFYAQPLSTGTNTHLGAWGLGASAAHQTGVWGAGPPRPAARQAASAVCMPPAGATQEGQAARLQALQEELLAAESRLAALRTQLRALSGW